MFHGGLLVAVSLLYIAVLFGIAWFGDRRARTHGPSTARGVKLPPRAGRLPASSWGLF